MILNTNLSAINTHRSLSISNKKSAKSMEKLSSGFRINRSADDAAGLAISEKMRNQIKGLNKASQNIQDGISLVQTADGAMSECHEILGRMRELTIQAANDTNVTADRNAIQKEIDGLSAELRAIVGVTEFNGTKVLQGSGSVTGADIKSLPDWVGIFPENGYMKTISDMGTINTDLAGITDTAYAVMDFSALNSNNLHTLEDTSVYHSCTTCGAVGNITFFSGSGNDSKAWSLNTGGGAAVLSIDITGISSGAELVDKILQVSSSFGLGMSHDGMLSEYKGDPNKLLLYDRRSYAANFVGNGWGMFDRGFNDGNGVVLQKDLLIQTSANEEHLYLSLPNMRRVADMAERVDVSSHNSAEASLALIDDAAAFTSTERTRMGAYQNRLEHTMKDVDNTALNLTASESRIRDTDMAKEMMELTKSNILINAGNSMLAHNFDTSRQVIELLR